MRTAYKPFSYLLLPFAWLYGGVVRLRNFLYDRGFFQVYTPPIPVICVGNLTVGGTGKTPQVEYLARLLQSKKMAILSRGYQRKTTGFVLADEKATPKTIGDEPFQYTQNLPQVVVAVCENRATGIQKLLKLHPDLDLILLDDAFQHRAVRASKYLLLTDYHRLFYQDSLLPVGRLREPTSGARRAHAVVVTKCPPELSEDDQRQIRRKTNQFTEEGTPVFFSKIDYAPAVPLGKQAALVEKLLLVTGIAQPQPLVTHLHTQGYQVLKHFDFPDHATYSPERVKEVMGYWQTVKEKNVSVLLTQKDAVKWQTPELEPIWKEGPVFYVPIAVSLAPVEPSFDDLMRQWAGKAVSEINF